MGKQRWNMFGNIDITLDYSSSLEFWFFNNRIAFFEALDKEHSKWDDELSYPLNWVGFVLEYDELIDSSRGD